MCSHYVLCVFFKYKTHIHGFNKTMNFSVRIKIDNESKPKLYIYILPLFPKVRFFRFFTFIKNPINVYYLI